MPLVLDGTTGLAGAVTGTLNGALGGTTPSTVSATTVTASGFVGTAATGALKLPLGTTAERPTASTGMIRYNSSTGNVEYYNGTAWYNVTATTPVAVTSGGTGASTASAARTNLGLAYGPAFSAYPNTAQTISSGGTLVKVDFGSEEFDTNNNFDSSTFTPTVAGYYQVDACVRFDGGGPGTGECMIVVFKNGGEAKRGWNSSGINFANDWWSMSVSTLVYCNGSTDYLEIYIQQVSGGSRTTTPYANISYFQAFLARPA